MLKRETVMTGAEHPGTPLKVMKSGYGYYLGFEDPETGGPYSRETIYFETESAARFVLTRMRRQ